MKRFILSFIFCSLFALPMQLFAATTPTSNIVASQLVTQFLGVTSNIVVEPAAPAPALNAGVVANQTGTLNSADLGLITVAPQVTPLTPVIMGKQGIILTNGHMGGTSTALATGGDADIATALTTTTGTFDAASLSFTFTVTGAQTAVTFDLVFASNETIGAVNPDAVVVMVDGVNYATLNNGGILSNQTAGILIATPVQVVTGFTSASQVFTVTAPLIGAGTHTFKIAIADNVDRLRDSAVIVANLQATNSLQGGMGIKGTDFFPPIITIDPAVGAVVTQEATALLTPVNLGAHTVTDNFAPVPQAIPAPTGPYAVGTRVVTWSATDAAGNIGTATQTVTVTDTTPPVIIPPLLTAPGGIENVFSTANPTYQADITAYLATVSATDLGAPLVAVITNNAPIAGFPIGTTTVTFNVIDASGNAAVAVTRDIIVTANTIQPQATALNLANRLVSDANITQINTAATPALAVNQTGEILVNDLGLLIAGPPPVSLLLPNTGIMLTTGNITGTGNNLNAPNPAIGADADVSAALAANPLFNTAGTFDASTLAFSFTVPQNTLSISFDIIYATNEAIGGVQFPDAAVVMIDGTNRALFNNGSLLSNLNGAFLTATNGTLVPGFTNVSQVQTLTATLTPTLNNVHTIKISIADNNDGLIDSAIIIGNMTTSTTVNQSGMGVGDVFPPIIATLPANITVEATGALTSANIGAPVVTDNVDVAPRAIASNLGPYPLGLTTITWLATDLAGNVSLPATTTVTVVDTTAPVFSVVPAPLTIAATLSTGLPNSNPTLATHLATVRATDALGIRSITNNGPAIFPIGTTTVTFTATDLFGSTSTATTNIIVTAFVAGGGAGGGAGPAPVANGIDQIPPVIKLVGNKNVTVLQTLAVALYVDPGATVIDNFDGPTPGVIPATTTVDTSIAGRSVLTYNATDAAGNTASIIRTVDVVAAAGALDVLPPVITPPLDILVASTSFAGIAKTDPALAAFFAVAPAAGATLTAVDNVGLAGAITNNAPAVIPVGKTTVTFTARDIQGNIGTAEAVITVSGVAQNPGAATDFDLDGMPDAWEIAIFGDITLATAGPATDFDLDGITDALERILGTNPLLANTNASGAINDLKDAVYITSPSDSDGDGIWDILEDNTSVLDPTVVTGIPAVSGITTFTIRGNGNPIQSVAVNQIGSAPASVIDAYGMLSYSVLTTIGGTVTIQINSSQPFGTNALFYKVDAAGNYTVIPAANVSMAGANTINLTLTDGGPLDLDGVANGIIVDPVVFGASPAVLGANGGAGGAGGGCAMQTKASFDPLLPLLFTIALLFLLMRRKQRSI